ncbi:uncharacterized protein BO66DRAFT_350451 [Aspergillus aculeatinus CBS 121060]|uniref:Uncharacterized protein n=1 Tax=Aspergillus aculeatinus CBS 121060 TaxID=1448322 RepID=A0ACD1H820_9EURO|nr:hypothetical protein BO66DRAFT_350451 [Aspergillus aculeatinus CBS 121060]RAH69779.1 hypothetical protein BO66DRAFT_350451 [Aspergillus aculeatinus CBS 121060]
MAHRAHRIPWRSLTSHLIHRTPTHTSPDTTIANLYFRFLPTQAKDLGHFATSFARVLDEDTTAARQQYAPKYLPPARDELLLDDRLAARIHPLTFRWHHPKKNIQKTQQLCQHIDSTTDFACGCPLPYTERRAAAFLRPYQWNDCSRFEEVNGDGFFNLQVVSTLLVLGEMEIIFRLCAHPDIGLKEWMRVQDCSCIELCEMDHGWGPVFDAALEMYLTLNTLYCFPELHSSSSSSASEHAAGSRAYAHDYRTTKMYQRPVDEWTCLWQATEMSRYPHRQFLGLEPQFGFASQVRIWDQGDPWYEESCARDEEGRRARLKRLWQQPEDVSVDALLAILAAPEEKDCFTYGELPFPLFLASDKAGFRPSQQDTSRIEAYLRERGVPDDWAAEMTTLSGEGNKEPRSRLCVPHDPLHERNRRQLRRYLHRCWQIMVRCNMLARELGVEIDWAWEVVRALEKLVSCPPEMKLYNHRYDPERLDVYTVQGGSEELSYAIRVRREE